MTIFVQQIIDNLSEPIDEEHMQILAQKENVKFERIISRGHSSEKGFWYDQEQDEFVLLLKGKARLRFFNETDDVTLSPGDYLIIKAHHKHRVEWTLPEEETVWLAVHF